MERGRLCLPAQHMYITIKSHNFREDIITDTYDKLISTWETVRNTLLSGIKTLTVPETSPEKASLIDNIKNTQSIVMTHLSNAKDSFVKELNIVSTNTTKAGSQLLNWIVDKFNALRSYLGTIVNTLANAVTTAAKASFNFLKNMFNSMKTQAGGAANFLKTTNFLGFPVSTWLIWGTIAAFCIIVFSKFVKWLKRRNTNNTQEALEQYLISDNLFTEHVRFSEAVTESIYQNAALEALDLDAELMGAERGNISWKSIKTISIILLYALGIFSFSRILTNNATA